MAVNNQLARQPMADKSITYQVNGENITLSPSIVRNYLVNGNGNVTDQEVAYFLNLCKYQRLNPLVRECYLIKYGNQPATMVTGKDALLKRAMRNPKYKGHEAGVIVMDRETGKLEYRVGSLVLPNEDLVGGWAKTYVEGYSIPIEASVSFREFAGFKGDGQLNSMWAGKPGTMIRKTALVTSLREAFPEDLGGLYDQSEMGLEIDESAMAPVEVPIETEVPQTMDAPQNTVEELDNF